jgi:hypothetical protein
MCGKEIKNLNLPKRKDSLMKTNLTFAEVKKELAREGITVVRGKATLNGKQLYMLEGSGSTDGILMTAQEIVEECKRDEIGW